MDNEHITKIVIIISTLLEKLRYFTVTDTDTVMIILNNRSEINFLNISVKCKVKQNVLEPYYV